MTNNQVGNVYQQIIQDVIESSRVDFEEGGVDEHVLEELKLGWQQKLSQLQVATFPWDPKPEPPPMPNPPTVPSNAGNYQPMGTPPMPQPQNASQPMQPINNNSNGPRIKTEPGMEPPALGMNQGNFNNPLLGMANATPAQQRAAQHLQANYGPRAAASIDAIRGVAPQQQQPQQPQQQQQPNNAQLNPQQMQQQHMQNMQQPQQQQQQRPGAPPQQQPQQRPGMTPEQYRQAMAAQAQARLQGQNGINTAQTDGSGDFEDGEESVGVIMRMNPNGESESMGRIEIDNLIRTKIEAMGRSMEGGGLMLPLRQTKNLKSTVEKRVKREHGHIPQTDGLDDDDDDDDKYAKQDEDEDAINSDLDDPDDGLNDEEDDDEGMGHIMLCMYDKVQRVKNKWKCVMKDGVLTVNGKEYVFHKASGEYEW
ncbi:putative transcription initiation factor IIA large subunit [Xylogone sp. PMI_703]|nr:putative transcription initiation factor IIA large subunit [Xylogone sp. PMI_703]